MKKPIYIREAGFFMCFCASPDLSAAKFSPKCGFIRLGEIDERSLRDCRSKYIKVPTRTVYLHRVTVSFSFSTLCLHHVACLSCFFLRHVACLSCFFQRPLNRLERQNKLLEELELSCGFNFCGFLSRDISL